jgi:hypothetical protein
VRDPIRTIKRAAPLAMILVAIAYLAVNVAYFAVVSKQDMLEGGTMAAYGLFITKIHIYAETNSFRALFFRNIFGPATERVSDGSHAFRRIFLCNVNPGFECCYCTVSTRKPYEHPVHARQRLCNFTYE